MIIALFPNTKKSQPIKVASEIREFLSSHGVCVVSEDFIAEEIGARALSSIDIKTIDFAISLGGDGTILRLVHRHPNLQAPIIGINLGSLGFLADIPSNDINKCLQELLDGNFRIQERMILQGRSSKASLEFAVNDIVIHRAQNLCLIDLAIYVDDRYLNTFSADGVIVATPGGSTAYSLSAGGPILAPELRALAITPVCPHTISNRPIVLMPKESIRIEYISHHDPIEITYDGFSSHSLSEGENLVITLSAKPFKLVNLLQHDYFSTLRSKLGWTGKLRV